MKKALQKKVQILQETLPDLKKKYPLKRIGIFGSFREEKETPKSDIDILVEFYEPIGFFSFIRLERVIIVQNIFFGRRFPQ